MTDADFPLISYQASNTPREWGQAHGEEFAGVIAELAQIRRDLILSKSPKLKDQLTPLAQEQLQISSMCDADIAEEIIGIAEGSNLSKEQIVTLNNYTDFRDIDMAEEGCSTVHINSGGKVFAGQTWDMHQSAKNYVCLIKVPGSNNKPGMILFSLVGCVGMMGVNSSACLVGVNNLNTTEARPGVIWPLLVRRMLKENTREKIVETMKSAKITSGRNYMIADQNGAYQWEVTPTRNACAQSATLPSDGYTFHTNHALTTEVSEVEKKSARSSTTFERFGLIEKKIPQAKNLSNLKDLLSDHEGYPKSICCHYSSGTQDPSMTCGGGIADLNGGELFFWRGCKTYDKNYKSHSSTIADL